MEIPSLFDGLADIGLRGSVDTRPTLIRVLTDLYVQKLSHTPDEEQRYAELALRLLDTVDVVTRATVAAKLAPHLSPPRRVVQYLVNDLPEIAAPLRDHPVLRPSAQLEAPAPQPAGIATEVVSDEIEEPVRAPTQALSDEVDELADPVVENSADATDALDPATALELNQLFFTSNEDERRLILLNLHVVAPLSAGHVAIARDPNIGQRLEAAALGNYREDFANQLAHALHIPREQARRITRDDLGEPVVVAVKALGVARDVFHRILMFANPAVGHSVERVQALAGLYDEMTLPAAESMVAIWQALTSNARSEQKHQPLHWNDERSRARSSTTVARRPQPAPRTTERRNAS
jgi:hypothetical protein